MKSYLYMIMAAATLVVVGCEKNIETIPGEDAPQETTLSISLPSVTKISFDGNDNFKSAWEEGDEIKVQTGANSYSTYTLYSGAGEKKATFTGRGTPMNGGKVLYPADKWNNNAQYTFATEYVWDEAANEANKFRSEVPMAGEIKGTTANFDYVAGGISIIYSKVTLTTAKFVITLGGTTPVGTASLNSDGTELSAPANGSNTITIKMKEDGSQIGGTPHNARFFFPVPAGSYSSINMKLYREDGQVVGGSDYSMASGKSFSVANKELKVLPTIVPAYPVYYFTGLTTGDNLTDGEYILVYQIDDKNAWVNGDDDIREVIPGELITIEELPFVDSQYWGKTGIKLDLADYETGAWKMTYDSQTRTWSAQTAGKGIFDIKDGGWNGDYIQLAYLMDARQQTWWTTTTYYAWCKWIRYLGPDELDRTGDSQWADPKFDNGVFLIPSPEQGEWTTNSNPNINNFSVVQQSNLKIFRLIGEDEL